MSSNRDLLRYFILIFFFLLTSLSWRSQASAGDLRLAWNDNSNNEDGFKIERKTGTTGTFSQIATVGVNITSYSDTNLIDGATYCYRLAAFNSAGSSAYTPEGCATARSTIQNFALTVTKTGNGTVTSSLPGISCGSDCNESYPSGTTVTLSAIAAAGSVFSGWSGNSDCTDGSVTMDANKACAATFNAAPQAFTLSVNVVKAISSAGTGNGTVTSNPAGINCGGDCSESYTSGTVVVLNALPAAGSVFSGWSGDSDCSNSSVTMNNNRNCTATFNAQSVQTFSLSVNKTGTGNGTVISNPAGINCGNDCSQPYTAGTVVVLSAFPAAGSVFSSWTGSGCSTGSVTMNGSRSCTAVFRLGDQQISSDFDNDSVTDTAVYQESTGHWFFVGSTSGFGQHLSFGGPGFLAVSGDYDGDGETDAAVYHGGAANWFVVGSSGGFFTPALNFGGSGFIPVPGDYDGDGNTDVAVYQSSTGNWFVKGSSAGFFTPALNFGRSGFIPVPGDYDGDGKTDAAVYQSSTGNWFIQGSSAGFFTPALNFGRSGFIPVPGDYDGDGKTDAAVYQSSIGNWFIQGSSAGFFTPALNFGGSGFVPVAGDYDGDGETDAAVYQSSTGNWFVKGSSAGFFAPALNFGGSGFLPVLPQVTILRALGLL